MSLLECFRLVSVAEEPVCGARTQCRELTAEIPGRDQCSPRLIDGAPSRTTSINYCTAGPCSFWPSSNSIAIERSTGRLLNYISSCTHAKCIYNPTIIQRKPDKGHNSQHKNVATLHACISTVYGLHSIHCQTIHSIQWK